MNKKICTIVAIAIMLCFSSQSYAAAASAYATTEVESVLEKEMKSLLALETLPFQEKTVSANRMLIPYFTFANGKCNGLGSSVGKEQQRSVSKALILLINFLLDKKVTAKKLYDMENPDNKEDVDATRASIIMQQAKNTVCMAEIISDVDNGNAEKRIMRDNARSYKGFLKRPGLSTPESANPRHLGERPFSDINPDARGSVQEPDDHHDPKRRLIDGVNSEKIACWSNCCTLM